MHWLANNIRNEFFTIPVSLFICLVPSHQNLGLGSWSFQLYLLLNFCFVQSVNLHILCSVSGCLLFSGSVYSCKCCFSVNICHYISLRKHLPIHFNLYHILSSYMQYSSSLEALHSYVITSSSTFRSPQTGQKYSTLEQGGDGSGAILQCYGVGATSTTAQGPEET